MAALDETRILEGLSAPTQSVLARLEVFETIGSTNTYLADGEAPPPGQVRVAIADQQTAGRGRQNREWVSPAGSGLYQSLAYSVASARSDFSALTLALGVGVLEALKRFTDADIKLKWPNDLVAEDCKLGGLLTETRVTNGKLLVIAGIGINLRMDDATRAASRSGWAQQGIALEHLDGAPADRNGLASAVTDEVAGVFTGYEENGFKAYADLWRRADWLRGRIVSVETPASRVTGEAAGVSDDGALLLETNDGVMPVSAGTVTIEPSQ